MSAPADVAYPKPNHNRTQKGGRRDDSRKAR